jgi:uncharacterized protein
MACNISVCSGAIRVIRIEPAMPAKKLLRAFPTVSGGKYPSTHVRRYNVEMTDIPSAIRGRKYISLATFRKSGVPVYTPVWFAEEDGKLYIFTNPTSGKVKRMRNNSQVRIAPCTMRGKIIGPEFAAKATILPPQDWPRARRLLEQKYWLMKIPFVWGKDNVFAEIEVDN